MLVKDWAFLGGIGWDWMVQLLWASTAVIMICRGLEVGVAYIVWQFLVVTVAAQTAGFDLTSFSNSTWDANPCAPIFLPHAGGYMALTWGAKRQDQCEVSQRVRGIGGGSLRVLGSGVEGEMLVKHCCLVVCSDPPPWTVYHRPISSSAEQESKGELAVHRGPTSSPRL